MGETSVGGIGDWDQYSYYIPGTNDQSLLLPRPLTQHTTLPRNDGTMERWNGGTTVHTTGTTFKHVRRTHGCAPGVPLHHKKIQTLLYKIKV